MSDVDASKIPGLVSRRITEEKDGRRSVVVLGNNNDPLESEQRIIDRTIFTELDGLRMAPTAACLCKRSNCTNRRHVVQTMKRYIQKNGYICLTPEGYSDLCVNSADRRYVELKYDTFEKRICTFTNDERCDDAPFNRKLANAGFYVKPEAKLNRALCLACYRCPLSLRMLMLDKQCDPIHEHARWFPTCAHVIHQKEMEYIHGVLEDTRKIQQEHEEMRRVDKQISGE